MAREKGLSTFIGHKKGIERIDEIVIYAQDLGIKIVTIYTFSTENYKRAKKEVSYLMKIFEDFVINKIIDIHKQGMKVRILGDFRGLPWQGVYSELYFSKVLWPDFNKKQLDIAIKDF